MRRVGVLGVGVDERSDALDDRRARADGHQVLQALDHGFEPHVSHAREHHGEASAIEKDHVGTTQALGRGVQHARVDPRGEVARDGDDEDGEAVAVAIGEVDLLPQALAEIAPLEQPRRVLRGAVDGDLEHLAEIFGRPLSPRAHPAGDLSELAREPLSQRRLRADPLQIAVLDRRLVLGAEDPLRHFGDRGHW